MTIILDTNPAAWTLLRPTLSLSSAVANLLVFINAHLACNYTNQVAVIASHCDKAQWLYPTAAAQKPPGTQGHKIRQKQHDEDDDEDDDIPVSKNKRPRTNGTTQLANGTNDTPSMSEGDARKYRPFRLIEEELTRNLTALLSSTPPETIHRSTSTMVAGALTIALSYINRRTQEYQESLTGVATISDRMTEEQPNKGLQSRILIITLSPSTDLAHQYIPIMNSIFACQRLQVPIDVLQLPLSSESDKQKGERSSTVFLQQASDATKGIFIAAKLSPQSDTFAKPPRADGLEHNGTLARYSMLTYLLTSLLPAPSSRLHLITPTRVDVDFRAACFCHRNVISLGFVCSICLSIFCDQSLEILSTEGCITCGTKLTVRDEGVGGWAGGKKPVVVAQKKKKKKKGAANSTTGTPRPATPA